MEVSSSVESEIKSWLQLILKKLDIEDLSVSILGNSEKGDGFIGDIVFVHVTGVTRNGSTKEYKLVLKCSKRSQALREKFPVKEAFLNEIYIYETVFPKFTQFQIERGIQEPFESVPTCFGTFISNNMEVVVLENLKENGYSLWDKKKPLTRQHIDMVVKKYGKFHAISIAMKEQQPEQFKELTSGLDDPFMKLIETTGMESVFGATVEEIHDLLKGELAENILVKWKNLKQQIHPFFQQVFQKLKGLNVITHGDCWNNNFMFQNTTDGLPSKVAFLDWQMANVSLPVFDLSYFIFTCIAKEDLEDLDVVLKEYYESLTDYSARLGSNVHVLYPFDQFLNDWKKYSKFGVIMTCAISKYAFSEKDDVPDMVQAAERGEDVSKTFLIGIKDTTGFKNRVNYIVKYVVEHGLV